MTSAPAKEAGLLPCPCYRCAFEAHGDEPVPFFRQRMFTCPRCGNKRCPHATDHRLTCTGSNEPGQEGSSYGVPLAAPWNTRAPSPSPDQPAGEDKDTLIRDLTARAEAAEGVVVTANRMMRLLDANGAAIAPYLRDTYETAAQRLREDLIVFALATEAKDGRAG